MKRIIILSLLVVLVACGNENNIVETTKNKNDDVSENEDTKVAVEDEGLQRFINNYNYEVKRFDDYEEDLPELVTIKQSDIEDLNEHDEGFARSLVKYEFEKNSGYYEILATYDNDEQLKGYLLKTQNLYKSNGEFISIDDKGKVAGAVMADALGLDIDDYYDTLNNLLSENKNPDSYNESGFITVFELDPTSNVLKVNFIYEEQDDEDETNDNEQNEESPDVEENTNDSDDNVIEIDWKVNNIVDADLDNTTITDLRINEDASTDEERYIVLVDLEWDVKNKPSTTKDMLDMYSDHLAAKLAEDKLIHNLVLFWTVPYHDESNSILKRQYENRDGGMYLEDEMKDVNVFN